MRTLSITRTVTSGIPERRYAITFEVGATSRTVVVESGGHVEILHGVAGRYRPGSLRLAESAIQEFDARVARLAARVAPERANGLAIVGREGDRRIGRRLFDQQLPVADRA